MQSCPCLQRPIGIAALLCLAFVTVIPAPVAAADRELLYGKAEDLICYTDDVKGLSALMLAAKRGMPVLIPALVKAGADVNARGRDGTSLGLAAEEGQTAVVQALLDANADPDLGTKDNRTPLMKAAAKDRVEIIALLLAHCARTDLVDSFFKWNALKFAKSDAARNALQAGRGVNCK